MPPKFRPPQWSTILTTAPKVKTRRQRRPPVPLQSSPVDSRQTVVNEDSVDDLFDNALKNVDDQGEQLNSAKSLGTITIFKDPHVQWVTLTKAESSREQFEAVEDISEELNPEFELWERENAALTSELNLIRTVRHMVADEDLDVDKRLRDLVLDLVDTVPLALTGWVQRHLDDKEDASIFDLLIQDCKHVKKISEANIEELKGLKTKGHGLHLENRNLKAARNQYERMMTEQQREMDDLEEDLTAALEKQATTESEMKKQSQRFSQLLKDSKMALDIQINDLKAEKEKTSGQAKQHRAEVESLETKLTAALRKHEDLKAKLPQDASGQVFPDLRQTIEDYETRLNENQIALDELKTEHLVKTDELKTQLSENDLLRQQVEDLEIESGNARAELNYDAGIIADVHKALHDNMERVQHDSTVLKRNAAALKHFASPEILELLNEHVTFTTDWYETIFHDFDLLERVKALVDHDKTTSDRFNLILEFSLDKTKQNHREQMSLKSQTIRMNMEMSNLRKHMDQLQDASEKRLQDAKDAYNIRAGRLKAEHEDKAANAENTHDRLQLRITELELEALASSKTCTTEKSELVRRINDEKDKIRMLDAEIKLKDTANRKIQDSEKQCQEEIKKLKEFEAEHDTVTAELTALKLKHEDCEKDRTRLTKDKAEHQTKITTLEASLATYTSHAVTASTEAENLRSRIKNLEDERDNLTKKVDESQRDYTDCRKDCSEKQVTIENLEKEKTSGLENLRAKENELDRSTTESKLEIMKVEKERDNIKKQLEQCTIEKDQQKTELETQVESVKSEVQHISSQLQNCQKDGQNKDDTMKRWKYILLTFVLGQPEDDWIASATAIGDFANIFDRLASLKDFFPTDFDLNNKLKEWTNAMKTDHVSPKADPIVLLLQIWYQLVHPSLAPSYASVIDLVHNLQFVRSDHLNFVAACLEYGLEAQALMTNPAPSQWNASQSKAWLRLIDLLCILYGGVDRFKFDISIDLSNGRRSVLVDRLYRYVAARLNKTSNGHTLGRFIADYARNNDTGVVKGKYDIVPDGLDLIVVRDALGATTCTVTVLSSRHFMLEHIMRGWWLTMNHLETPGEAVKVFLEWLERKDRAIVNSLMTDAVSRKKGGNIGFERLTAKE